MKARSIHDILEGLTSLRRQFSDPVAEQRLELLLALQTCRLRTASSLRQAHGLACFACAYPDDPLVLEAARVFLACIGARVRSLSRPERAKLENAPIDGAATRTAAAYDVARRLSRLYPEEVDIDWRKYESPELLDPMLERFLSYPETQTFDDGEVSTRQWLRLAKGERPTTDLGWLLAQLDAFVPDERRRRELYDAAEPPLLWKHGSRPSPVLDGLGLGGPVSFQSHGIRRMQQKPGRLIVRPLRGIRRMQPLAGEKLIQVGIETLIQRGREVYALSRGNPHEVYVAPLGEGAMVVIVGVLPEARLVLEANYGYMIFKNGMAVGYGGASPLFSQANTGINIFEEYRGGESAILFVGVLRAIRTLFGTTRFIANPYQFGSGNSEAVQSGAFWFYHALGFRSADREVRRLADAEAVRLARRRAYRSDRATLRRLARGDLHLALGRRGAATHFDEAGLGKLATAVTRLLSRHRSSSRRAGIRKLTTSVASALGVDSRSGWPACEQRSFDRLAPLVALMPDLPEWGAKSKRGLVDLMRAKGRLQERQYARLLARHRSLRDALKEVCRRAED